MEKNVVFHLLVLSVTLCSLIPSSSSYDTKACIAPLHVAFVADAGRWSTDPTPALADLELEWERYNQVVYNLFNSGTNKDGFATVIPSELSLFSIGGGDGLITKSRQPVAMTENDDFNVEEFFLGNNAFGTPDDELINDDTDPESEPLLWYCGQDTASRPACSSTTPDWPAGPLAAVDEIQGYLSDDESCVVFMWARPDVGQVEMDQSVVAFNDLGCVVYSVSLLRSLNDFGVNSTAYLSTFQGQVDRLGITGPATQFMMTVNSWEDMEPNLLYHLAGIWVERSPEFCADFSVFFELSLFVMAIDLMLVGAAMYFSVIDFGIYDHIPAEFVGATPLEDPDHPDTPSVVFTQPTPYGGPNSSSRPSMVQPVTVAGSNVTVIAGSAVNKT